MVIAANYRRIGVIWSELIAVIPPNLSVWRADVANSYAEVIQLDLPEGVVSFDQLCAHLPSGAYTTLRTFEYTRALHLEAHLARLQETAELVGAGVILDKNAVRHALRQVVGSPHDLRVRLILDLEVQPGDLYLAVTPLETPPPEAYTQGVWVVTVDLERTLPRAKLTRFITQAYRARQSLPTGVHEALMVRLDGYILEGLSSNFFAVQAGEIWTADLGVLAGTTRAWVLELAAAFGIPLNLEGVKLGDLPCLEEAFITSASRGVLPVRQIEETLIGRGLPGPVTHQIMKAYHKRLTEELEEI